MRPTSRILSYPLFFLLGLGLCVGILIVTYHFLPRAKWVEEEGVRLGSVYGMPLSWNVIEASIDGLHAEAIQVGDPPFLKLDSLTITREGLNLHILAASGDLQVKAEVPVRSYKTDGIKVDIPEVTFRTGAMQPDRVIPVLRRHVQGVEGSLRASGTVWIKEEGKVTTDMEVVLRSISAEVQGNIIEGMDGNIHLTQLWPPQTEPKQEIRIASLQSGLPLANGVIQFSLDHPKLLLDSMRWRWGEGLLQTENVSVDFKHPDDTRFTFVVKNLPLQEVVRLDQSEFYSDGKISGKIPVHMQQGKIIIKNGKLETPLAGIIRYTPANLGSMENPHVGLVFSILKNFFFQRLLITLNSDEEGIVRAHVALYGNNPDVYEGRPVDLNIRLEGNIFDLLKSGTDTYNLPDKIIEGLGL